MLRSPLTNLPMAPHLVPNLVLRSLIEEYVQAKRDERRKKVQCR